jgi:outer membrane protein assembly factor BamD (BamD/ComL family)
MKPLTAERPRTSTSAARTGEGCGVALVAGLLAAAVLAATLTASCASQAVQYTRERKLFVEADSLFEAGNFEYAIRKYSRIRNEYPRTPTGANAQYNLGFIHVYYENPFADYEAALREFRQFAKMYPKDRRIDEVNNWIRILTVLRDFAMHYEGNKEQLLTIKQRHTNTSKEYTNIQDAWLSCDAKVDSLQRRIIVLQGNVEALEKIITELERIK